MEMGVIRGYGWLGANVTVPFKESVIPFLDAIDPRAAKMGAVNTVVKCLDILTGYNTDVLGFETAMVKEAHFDARGCEALVIGAGGSSRAIILALASRGTRVIRVANRTFERAQSLVSSLWQSAREEIGGTLLSAIPLEERQLKKVLLTSQVIVNCTTVGMAYGPDEGKSPLFGMDISKDSLVCDLVYNPLVTPLLRQACEAGAATLSGLHMLVYQGAAAFSLWTGLEAPVGVMFAAARKALTESNREK
jgi:shikimate dehydrogenase